MKALKHLTRVKSLPCAICGSVPVDAHHIRKAPLTGAGGKASDWFTFPLCRADHDQLHADTPLWEMRYGDQVQHVVRTLERLYG